MAQRKRTQDIERADADETATHLPVEDVPIDSLTPHPRNYQMHPEDELEHIRESIRMHGFYRNVVATQGGTILAGHGVVEAARLDGYTHVPVVRVPYKADDPRALAILIGDNEIRHLAEVDDRALSELLRDLSETAQLLGTGYDEMMLANLVMVTRTADEIPDIDAAKHWAGMPEYDEEGERRIQIIVNFANEDDRQEFGRILGIEVSAIGNDGRQRSIWWPKKMGNDLASVRFIDGEGDAYE